MISDEEKARRAQSVQFSRDNSRLEGIETPDPEFDALCASYVKGDLTDDEFTEQSVALTMRSITESKGA